MLTQDDLKQFAGTNRYYRHWLRRFVRPRLTIPECCGNAVPFRALSSVVVPIKHFFLARTPSKQASSSSVPL